MKEKIRELYLKYQEIVNYLIVGVLTTVVSLAVKWGLLFLFLDAADGFQLQVAVVISWIAAVTFAYVTNRKFVFKSKNPNLWGEILRFFGARLATLGMEMLFMWFFVTYLGMDTKLWVLFWTVAVQGLIIIANYVFSKLFVFVKKQ